MPVVQKIPFQKHDQEEEGKAQHGRGQYESEEVIGLELGAGVQDRVTESALAYPAGAGEELPCDGTNHRDAGRDADADKERWHGMREDAAG